MCEDFLKTYDPKLFEVHSDSSDFEDNITVETPKQRKHKRSKITKKQKNIINNAITLTNRKKENSDLDLYTSNTLKASNVIKRNSTSTLMTKDDYQNECKSFNESKTRNRNVPCFSSIFGKPYYKMFELTEINIENTRDGTCSQKRNSERTQRKKYKKRNFVVQPVYAIEDPVFSDVKETQISLFHRKPKSAAKQFSDASVTASISSEPVLDMNNKDYKKMLKEELKREFKIYTNKKYRKHQEQQFPSKIGPYQIFSNPYQEKRTVKKKQSKNKTASSSSLAAKSSSFWDNLVNKFCPSNKPEEKLKPCTCEETNSSVCSPGDCKFFIPGQETPKDKQCSCTNIPPPPPVSEPSDDDCTCKKDKGPRKTPLPTSKSPPPTSKLSGFKTKALTKINSKTKSEQVQCECTPKKSKQKIKPKNPPIKGTQMIESSSKPCLLPHDEIAKALTTKYKGEILCIHNPPCVLINGCLNLPTPRDNPVGVWSLTETKRGSTYEVYTNLKSLRNGCDQGCQYEIPVEVRHSPTTNVKAEKIIQSLCDHVPPCEIVRCCYKHKYDPKLKNSCIHVPMCQKVPECMIERTKQNLAVGSCEHKPRCAEVPICTRDYIIMTANDSVAIQARPQSKAICRHHPRCIFIPKCLGNGIESCLPIHAIPDCIHQPPCEMIPACCRNSAKEMTSVCSQYPSGCRVV